MRSSVTMCTLREMLLRGDQNSYKILVGQSSGKILFEKAGLFFWEMLLKLTFRTLCASVWNEFIWPGSCEHGNETSGSV